MRNEIAIVLVTSAIVHVATLWYVRESPRPLESARRTAPQLDETSRVVVVNEPCPAPSEGDTGSPADPACEQCLAAASSGNIARAASFANKCTDAGKKTQCTNLARSPAQQAVQSQARNGNCSGAKATAQAGAAMGIKGLDKILAKSGCN